MTDPVRINLGAGPNPIDGYDNTWDASQGKDAMPLALPDNSVDELRASHILEHFSHRGTQQVLKEWVRVLKPGGLMRIAVPDLETIARMYLAGEPGMFQGWLSGGQVDPLDTHLAQFDHTTLTSAMREAGLVGVHKWKGEDDCSGLPISLNLAGYKRPERWPKVAAAMSTPRLGFMDTFGAIMGALGPLGIPIFRRTGAYWGQCLTRSIQAALDTLPDFVLTIDYDSIFTLQDIEDLMIHAMQDGPVDALVPVQMNRVSNLVLMRPKGYPPHAIFRMELAEWDVSYYPISMGHFGCSLILADGFTHMKKPWFHSRPGALNDWGDDRTDDDVWFWERFAEAGLGAYLCPRVVIGHLENFIVWPDRQLNRIHQHPTEYNANGKPSNVWR